MAPTPDPRPVTPRHRFLLPRARPTPTNPQRFPNNPQSSDVNASSASRPHSSHLHQTVTPARRTAFLPPPLLTVKAPGALQSCGDQFARTPRFNLSANQQRPRIEEAGKQFAKAPRFIPSPSRQRSNIEEAGSDDELAIERKRNGVPREADVDGDSCRDAQDARLAFGLAVRKSIDSGLLIQGGRKTTAQEEIEEISGGEEWTGHEALRDFPRLTDGREDAFGFDEVSEQIDEDRIDQGEGGEDTWADDDGDLPALHNAETDEQLKEVEELASEFHESEYAQDIDGKEGFEEDEGDGYEDDMGKQVEGLTTSALDTDESAPRPTKRQRVLSASPPNPHPSSHLSPQPRHATPPPSHRRFICPISAHAEGTAAGPRGSTFHLNTPVASSRLDASTGAPLPLLATRPPFLRPFGPASSTSGHLSSDELAPPSEIDAAPPRDLHPLPTFFSPQRRGQKYVAGGMAASMRGWVLDIAQQISTEHQGRCEHVSSTVVGFEVEDVGGRGFSSGNGSGSGKDFVLISGKRCQGDQERKKVILIGPGVRSGRGLDVTGYQRKPVSRGDLLKVRNPRWEVDMGEELGKWLVGIEWSTGPLDAEDHTL
ncbi:hypothetical protein BDY21DRAFT_340989 [Lineolata rhizophorae]|uniref:Uncharacterized protein n=1 Tax=Lineolata rhizophorae TaxID=578093 RepID=A0A6A6P5F1_9PEZI|nr:hypothetical protein BDY21DRAFT_340989 [Lineolata rhizophorae]